MGRLAVELATTLPPATLSLSATFSLSAAFVSTVGAVGLHLRPLFGCQLASDSE